MTLQEYEVKRVEPFSFGKIAAAFSGIMGLLTGLMYLPFAVFMMVGGLPGGAEAAVPALMMFFMALVGILFFSAVYVGVGFAMGVLYGYVYNYLSSKIGGVEMVMDVEG